jgi:hypothetical protein
MKSLKKSISFLVIALLFMQILSFTAFAAGSTIGLADSQVTFGAYNASGTEVGAYLTADGNYSTWAKIFSENPVATEYKKYKANTGGTKMWVQADFNGLVYANSISINTRYSSPASAQLYLSNTIAGLSTATPIALTKGTTVSNNTPYTATFSAVSASYCRIVFTQAYADHFVANGNSINKIFIGTQATGDMTFTIAGNTTVDNTLTATVGNGYDLHTTRNWQSASSVDGVYSNISGATAQTYTTVANDISKYIRYSVSDGIETNYSNVMGPILNYAPQTGSTLALADSKVTLGAYNTSGTEVGATLFQNYSTWAKIFSENPLSTEYLSYKANTGGTKMWVQADFSGSVNVNGISILTRYSSPASAQLYLATTVEGLSTATPIALTKGTTANNNTPYTATFAPVSASYCRILFTEGYGGQLVTGGNGMVKMFLSTKAPYIVGDKTLTIAGNPTVRKTLTATAGNGLDGHTTRNWQIADTENGVFTNILGATNSTYILGNTQLGKYIRFSASNGIETIYSNVKGPISASLPGESQCLSDNKITFGALNASGTEVGATVYRNYATWGKIFGPESNVVEYKTLQANSGGNKIWVQANFGGYVRLNQMTLTTKYESIAQNLYTSIQVYLADSVEGLATATPITLTKGSNVGDITYYSASFPMVEVNYCKIVYTEGWAGRFISTSGLSISKIFMQNMTFIGGNATVTNATNNEVLTSITANSSIKGNIQIVNNSELTKTYGLYIASYDVNNKLVNVALSNEVTLNANDSTGTTLTTPAINIGTDAVKIVMYLWDGNLSAYIINSNILTVSN